MRKHLFFDEYSYAFTTNIRETCHLEYDISSRTVHVISNRVRNLTVRDLLIQAQYYMLAIPHYVSQLALSLCAYHIAYLSWLVREHLSVTRAYL